MYRIRMFVFLVFIVLNSYAAETTAVQLPAAETKANSHSWSQYFPYVPEKHEYNFELGGMWEQETLNWLGLKYGRHMGHCMFSKDEKCQQFLDFNAGVGHRSGTTEGLFLVGPRWQYVKFPEPYSPSFQIFGGMMSVHDNAGERNFGVYGVAAALTMSLHRKLNIKWESRIGGGEQLWAQTFISFSLKIDDWVDQFSGQMKKMGSTTLEATGTILKSTITAPKTLIEWFNKPAEDKSNDEAIDRER